MKRFACIWEFRVEATHRPAFVRHYGPDGSWAQLFRQAPGYIETLLLQDAADEGRYLTVDRWQSAEAYAAFRAGQGAAYEALDRLCEPFSGKELNLGSFGEVEGLA